MARCAECLHEIRAHGASGCAERDDTKTDYPACSCQQPYDSNTGVFGMMAFCQERRVRREPATLLPDAVQVTYERCIRPWHDDDSDHRWVQWTPPPEELAKLEPPNHFPCQICQGRNLHHEQCPKLLRVHYGGRNLCGDCDSPETAECMPGCVSWALLGKTWVRLRREESDRFLMNQHDKPVTAVPLSTPGRCCGHNRNHHSSPKLSCLICDCRKFDPDLCYHGHEAGCEHMVEEGEEMCSDCTVDGVRLTRKECPMHRSGARARQVGGDHYKDLKIQPWDIWEALDLDAFTGAILKYLLRDKGNRLEDLKKARHTLDRLIEIEEGKGQ